MWDDDDLRFKSLLMDVPKLPAAFGVLACFFNIILPGSGTLMAACFGKGGGQQVQQCVSLFQFLTSIFLIGWIFSVYWGVLIAKKSFEKLPLDKNAKS